MNYNYSIPVLYQVYQYVCIPLLLEIINTDVPTVPVLYRSYITLLL